MGICGRKEAEGGVREIPGEAQVKGPHRFRGSHYDG